MKQFTTKLLPNEPVIFFIIHYHRPPTGFRVNCCLINVNLTSLEPYKILNVNRAFTLNYYSKLKRSISVKKGIQRLIDVNRAYMFNYF